MRKIARIGTKIIAAGGYVPTGDDIVIENFPDWLNGEIIAHPDLYEWDEANKYPVRKADADTDKSNKNLNDIKVEACLAVDVWYEKGIQADVTYTSEGGITQSFQADEKAQSNVIRVLQNYERVGSVPNDFYWVASDNTHVPFTLKDLQNAYSIGMERGWSMFKLRQEYKKQIRDASTVGEVKQIIKGLQK